MDKSRWTIVIVVCCLMVATLALLQKFAGRNPSHPGETTEAPAPGEQMAAVPDIPSVPLPAAEPLPQGDVRVSAPPAFLFLPSTPEEDAAGMKVISNRGAALKPDAPAPASGKSRPEAGK
ncbi:MAG TPA: hypothetical protein VIV61_07350 [Candidatus Ozemobacteraceae bacterium]